MNSSTELNELFKGLSKFHEQLQQPVKNGENPYFKSNYVTLEGVQNAIDKAIQGTGLAYFQMVGNDENGNVGVSTTITHESGQWLATGCLTLNPQKKDPQGYGSAITYEKRYQLASLFGISSDVDDDGNAGTFTTTPKPKTPKSPILQKAENEFKNLRKQLQQQGYGNKRINDIASQAAQGITDPVDKYTATNQALRQMLGGKAHD